ncbi:MAG: tRNA dihydrouridine synthase, partial [Planctomycetia bacterium]
GSRSGKLLDDGDRPVCVQLMGKDPDEMGRAAALMEEVGYDVVDINFGCPVKKVLGRCRGGYLLGDPDVACRMIDRVVEAVKVPVTVKMRRGKDDSPQSFENFNRILDHAVDRGVVGVAVHGRTVVQRYDGRATWDCIGAVKRRHPHLVVFGSGDLFSAEDCLRMLTETGIDGVTIARGAIANPWIFQECLALWEGRPKPLPPTVGEQADLFDRQYALAIEQYGPERASRQIRKFGIKRSALHPLGLAIRDAFIGLNNPDDWKRVIDRYYRSAEFVGQRPDPTAAAAALLQDCTSCCE